MSVNIYYISITSSSFSSRANCAEFPDSRSLTICLYCPSLKPYPLDFIPCLHRSNVLSYLYWIANTGASM